MGVSKVMQARAVKTREKVILAAAEVFDEAGFAGASMKRIGQRAGTTMGAIYFHFKTKGELAQAVLDAQPDMILPFLRSEGLQRLVDITLSWSWALQYDPMLRAGVRLVIEQSAFQLQDDTLYADWKRTMIECLEVAREKGDLVADVDLGELVEHLAACFTGTQLYSQIVGARADLPQRIARLWHFLLPGIVASAEVAERIVLDPGVWRPEWHGAPS
ncbi:ScbR family autoregulator-binding transcription factor [Streptomyces sp. NBC_01304]|uniref:ScbR family autoregulator-binding transcription factor n=1 Tax=Streptomyces sp. NBC_01304 TaxID=2903818 RepID=UPI002E0D8074|nr:TetR/AcrR family transcriptional regulator [Streptomyces sp. NBC_01304]